ncbi:unnamed protein product [Fraxinus pennsylvanica]|uniref:Uncharacterized protein n=1 Tax=Fraxinus pennsylvanica TaxID=56036 RepID=A0AAD2E621_9LAMI|nr:unnamed protein product [Fraxinus pennsylvanica]
MSPQSPYSRLSSLIASLSPYLELAPESLTKEIENHLLIALSQIFVQVKQWTHEFDSDSDSHSHSEEDSMAMPADNSACSDVSTSYSDNGSCLAMVDLLYMHEDDILFEVLLQLFCMPFHPDPLIRGGCRLEVKNHKFFLASDLFNPIHIFHIFLAEILYDHQVLLDYLISKDRGASCAEYLLRSLRVACDSWNLFVKYPETEEAKHLLYSKRRKVLAGCLDSEEVLSSSRVRNDGAPSSLEMECKKVQLSDSKHGRNHRLPFVSARDCLVSLKTSIESLCQKNLFPYNPQALLLRLIRFQELCFKQ